MMTGKQPKAIWERRCCLYVAWTPEPCSRSRPKLDSIAYSSKFIVLCVCREAGTFSANILLVNVLFLFMGLRKWIQEDMRVKVCVPFLSLHYGNVLQQAFTIISNMQAKSAFEGQSGKFAQLAVSLWDHSMHTATDVEELQV